MFALVIGDAIHNLRAALDHLASGIIRTREPKWSRYFPTPEDWKNVVDVDATKKMEGALSEAEDLLRNKIRPIKNGVNYFRSLNSIDIEDKHNLVIPTVTIANITGVTAFAGPGQAVYGLSMGSDAAKPFTLVSSDVPLTLEGDPSTSVSVSFGPGTPLAGHPVIPALFDIRNLVAETLDAFADLIGR